MPHLGHSGSVRHICGGSEGCMCVYDPELNPNLKARRLVALDEVIDALNDYYHAQNPKDMHPADFITKRFEAPGHENLRYV